MLRNKQALVPYLLLAAALAAACSGMRASRCRGWARWSPPAPPMSAGRFRLVDQNGAVKTDRDFRGRYMLIYFGYSFCPDVCPTTLSVIAQALDKLGDKRVVPVFITIDPERDTPRVLADYMKAFGPDFVGLTGSADAIKAVEKEYRVYAVKKDIDPNNPRRGYGMDHSSVLYLMGPDGRLVSFYDEAISPDALVKELRGKL